MSNNNNNHHQRNNNNNNNRSSYYRSSNNTPSNHQQQDTRRPSSTGRRRRQQQQQQQQQPLQQQQRQHQYNEDDNDSETALSDQMLRHIVQERSGNLTAGGAGMDALTSDEMIKTQELANRRGLTGTSRDLPPYPSTGNQGTSNYSDDELIKIQELKRRQPNNHDINQANSAGNLNATPSNSREYTTNPYYYENNDDEESRIEDRIRRDYLRAHPHPSQQSADEEMILLKIAARRSRDVPIEVEDEQQCVTRQHQQPPRIVGGMFGNSNNTVIDIRAMHRDAAASLRPPGISPIDFDDDTTSITTSTINPNVNPNYVLRIGDANLNPVRPSSLPQSTAHTDATAAMPPVTSSIIVYNDRGQVLKESIFAESEQPGAYAGGQGGSYDLVAHARSQYCSLGPARNHEEYRDVSAIIESDNYGNRAGAAALPSRPSRSSSLSHEHTGRNNHCHTTSTLRRERVQETTERPPIVTAPVSLGDSALETKNTRNADGAKKGPCSKWTWIVGGLTFVTIAALAVVIPVFILGVDHEVSTANYIPGKGHDQLITDWSLVPNMSNATLEALKDRDSVQYQAYEWLSEDPYLETYDDWRIQQRFALATFYFALNGLGWTDFRTTEWLSYYISECDGWLVNHMGKGSCHEDGHVKIINMTHIEQDLFGFIPPEVSFLSRLEGLTIMNHDQENLTYFLPRDLSNSFPSLKDLCLSACGMHGTIPSELGLLTSLTSLDLRLNGLTSTLPTELGQLSHLASLVLDLNDLTGTIPTQLGSISTLTVFNITGNPGLDDSLPTGFCSKARPLLMVLETDSCQSSEQCCTK